MVFSSRCLAGRGVKRRTRGQGMSEYGLILCLIAVVAMATLGDTGETVNEFYGTVNASIVGATEGGVLDPNCGGPCPTFAPCGTCGCLQVPHCCPDPQCGN